MAVPACHCITRAATTLTKPMLAPTDMSNPPIRSASICPSATTNRTAACCDMLEVFAAVANFEEYGIANERYRSTVPSKSCTFSRAMPNLKLLRNLWVLECTAEVFSVIQVCLQPITRSGLIQLLDLSSFCRGVTGQTI